MGTETINAIETTLEAKVINPVFSIMKGIAIAFVVAGHLSIPIVERFVNQFHLAIFYFVAGYFFKEEYAYTPKTFLTKKVKALYIPFVKYGLVFLLLHNLFCRMYLYPQNETYTVYNYFQESIRLLFGLSSNEPFMGAMWFLPSLLLVSVSFLLISLLCRKMNKSESKYEVFRAITIIVLYFIGYMAIIHGVKNPYCIWNAMIILSLFYMGRLYNKYRLYEYIDNLLTPLICTGILIYTFYLDIAVRCQTNGMKENNIILFPIISLSGILLIYYISHKIQKLKIGNILSQFGKYSFEIMALHFVAFKLISLIQCFTYGYNWEYLSKFPVIEQNIYLWSIPYIAAGILIPIIIHKIICKLKTGIGVSSSV